MTFILFVLSFSLMLLVMGAIRLNVQGKYSYLATWCNRAFIRLAPAVFGLTVVRYVVHGLDTSIYSFTALVALYIYYVARGSREVADETPGPRRGDPISDRASARLFWVCMASIAFSVSIYWVMG